MTVLEVKGLTYRYGEGTNAVTALDDVTFRVEGGTILSVLGPSGCGKSTLLRLLAGLSVPTAGEILFDGVPVTGPAPNRSVVFQRGGLFPWMTALGNVAFALSKAHPELDRQMCRELAEDALNKVGLGSALHRWPSQLSGGMAQRVALARALFNGAELLLLDEPFSALDPKNRLELQNLLLSLWSEAHQTVVFVTHDIDEAIFLGDRILFLEPGRIRMTSSVKFPRPRERESVLTSADCCALRKKFIALFSHYGEAVGECV